MDLTLHTRVKAPALSAVIDVPSAIASSNAILTGAGQSRSSDVCTPTNGNHSLHSTMTKWDIRYGIKIATWNVSTLRTVGHQVALVHTLAERDIWVAGITEARLTGNGERLVEDSLLLYSGGTTHMHGVALLLRKSAISSLISWKPVSPRLLTARLQHKHGHLLIIVAYAPTEEALPTDKDLFYDLLDTILNNSHPHDHLILLGDFNAVTGSTRTGIEKVVGPYGSGITNDNSARLLQMCASHELAVLGSWFRRKNIHRLSWISHDGRTQKEIDHIITRNRNLFTSCRVFRGAECAANTDHYLVIAKMKFFLRKPKKHGLLVRKFDVATLQDNSQLSNAFSIEVQNRFAALENLSDDQIDIECSHFTKALQHAAAKTIGFQDRIARRPWISKEALDIIHQKSLAHKQGDHRTRNRLKRRFLSLADRDQELYYNKIADQVEANLTCGNVKPAYRAIKTLSGHLPPNVVRIKSESGQPCETDDEVLLRWVQYYSHLLNHPPVVDDHSLPSLIHTLMDNTSVLDDDPPTPEEVARAIRKLRNGRAAGPDNLPPELLKHAILPVSNKLCNIFQKVWRTQSVPSAWKTGTIISLYKGKGPMDDCKSYRPITLLSVVGKVFALVLLDRISTVLINSRRPQQSGFTKGRSTLDSILSLRLLAEIHREYRKPLFVAYVDFKAAFDSVDRSALWLSLRDLNPPLIPLNLIMALYNGTSANVRVGCHLSDSFLISSGVRQGCTIAPSLFCRIMDVIMDAVSTQVGIQIGQFHISDLVYADDAAILICSESAFADALLNVEHSAGKVGLHVSWTKTKTQNLGYGTSTSDLHIDGNTVEAVTSFCYLGSLITSASNSYEEALRRIGIAASVMERLKRIWSLRHLSIRTKFRIYATCVLPVLLYGSETWTLTKAEWAKVESFHFRCQRRILGIRWDDFITNTEVLERSGLDKIDQVVRKRRLSLFGHVARLPSDVPANIILNMACNVRDGHPPATGWSRPRGRPPLTWLHQICKDVNLSAGQAFTAARNKDVWSAIATAATATR